MEKPSVFYRYEDITTETGVCILEHKYYICEETPKGYWVSLYENYNKIRDVFVGAKRWVSKRGKKRYAYPTKEEALHNFKMRKQRQMKISNAFSARAAEVLRIIEEGGVYNG